MAATDGIAFVIGIIVFIFIVTISIFGYLKTTKIRKDYDNKMKDIVNQINSAQYSEYKFDKGHKIVTGELNKNIQNIQATYVDKDTISKSIATKKLDVSGNIKADSDYVDIANIRMSTKCNDFSDKARNQAEISNDTKLHKQLMIIGNRSEVTGEKRVGISDQLDVHGELNVQSHAIFNGTVNTNKMKVSDTNINEYIKNTIKSLPVDCKLSEWSQWGNCSKQCGGGVKLRNRTIITAPLNGGTPCPTLSESQVCNIQLCLNIDPTLKIDGQWNGVNGVNINGTKGIWLGTNVHRPNFNVIYSGANTYNLEFTDDRTYTGVASNPSQSGALKIDFGGGNIWSR